MEAAPIIVKKKKAGVDGGHHGGAWKVAYADFVTAMMAFFLLMWLLNATSEEQRKGLADYFDPSIPLSRNSAGGSGMMGGDEMLTPPDTALNEKQGDRDPRTRHKMVKDPSDKTAPDGDDVESRRRQNQDRTPEARFSAPNSEDKATEDTRSADDRSGEEVLANEKHAHGGKTAADRKAGAGTDGNADRGAGAVGSETAEAAAAARAAEAEKAALEAINRQIEAELAVLGQAGLSRHFTLRVTPEGLVIEIGDLSGEPLFGSGAATSRPILKTLIGVVTPILGLTTNDIAVVGHTDSTPYTSRSGYTNWDLSADRANAARRMLADAGLDPGRIVRVSGRAATAPISGDPRDARNRRIAITLLRKAAAPDDDG